MPAYPDATEIMTGVSPGMGMPAPAPTAPPPGGQADVADNPVIDAFRTIMQFGKALEQQGDPKAQAFKEHIAQLIQLIEPTPGTQSTPPSPVGPAMEGSAMGGQAMGGGQNQPSNPVQLS